MRAFFSCACRSYRGSVCSVVKGRKERLPALLYRTSTLTLDVLPMLYTRFLRGEVKREAA